jgi:hypothetical protein
MIQHALPVSLLPALVGAPLACAIAAYRLLPISITARWTVTIAAAFVGLAIVGPLPFVGRFGFLWASVTATAFAAALVTSRILLDARRKAAAAVPPETKL